jgi:hypothetical protein
MPARIFRQPTPAPRSTSAARPVTAPRAAASVASPEPKPTGPQDGWQIAGDTEPASATSSKSPPADGQGWRTRRLLKKLEAHTQTQTPSQRLLDQTVRRIHTLMLGDLARFTAGFKEAGGYHPPSRGEKDGFVLALALKKWIDATPFDATSLKGNRHGIFRLPSHQRQLSAVAAYLGGDFSAPGGTGALMSLLLSRAVHTKIEYFYEGRKGNDLALQTIRFTEWVNGDIECQRSATLDPRTAGLGVAQLEQALAAGAFEVSYRPRRR